MEGRQVHLELCALIQILRDGVAVGFLVVVDVVLRSSNDTLA